MFIYLLACLVCMKIVHVALDEAETKKALKHKGVRTWKQVLLGELV